MQKRKRSIQRQMDLQVLEEAETEARLEESIMDEEIVQKESKVFEIRRQRIRLEMSIAAAKKKTLLQRISTKVKSALDRLAYATDSLQRNSGAGDNSVYKNEGRKTKIDIVVVIKQASSGE